MKRTLSLTFTLLTFVTFVFVPLSFAQEVKIYYVIPTDRQAQDDINSTLDGMIKDAQALFAETMEDHGFENKTFTFESDSNGNAVVHHVNGKFNNAYYNNNAHTTAVDEIGSQSNSISLIVLDVSEGSLCGIGGGDFALIPASGQCFSTEVMAHELGHAFGLNHDLNLDGVHIPNSYTSDRMLTSFCSAEWLYVNPYFNPGQSSSTGSTTIQMLSPLASPPKAVRLRFEVADPDGLHQAQVLVPGIGGSRVIACKQLNGESNNFDIITTQTEHLSDGSVTLMVIDKKGDFASSTFSIDISSLISTSAVVHIPDTNLAEAIKESLGLTSEEMITQTAIQKLIGFYPANRQISDLTGIEYALNLEFTGFNENQIKDLTPLSGLTQLRSLQLGVNQLSNLKPLANLTSLTSLSLYRNQITDLNPLAELVGLKSLYLQENKISDITSLAGLTNLTYLYLDGNQISDISPLSNLTSLQILRLLHNPITDRTPLETLKSKNPNIEIFIDAAPVVMNKPPVFSDSSVTRLVPEGVATGTNVGDPVTATDPDTGDTLTYTLSGTDAGSFVIDTTTGQIKTKTGVELDFETKSSYTLTVTATDPEGLTTTIIVNINIQDIDETPVVTNNSPVFSDGSITRLIPEGVDAGTNIGSPVTATDPDTGDTLTYTLGGTDAGSFVIDSATGQLKTKAGVELDFETKSSYIITVTATDTGGLTATIVVNINLQDVNETADNNPPVFSDSSITRLIPEGVEAGTNIGSPVTATDPDTGDTLTYTLGGTDAGSFVIDTTTGQLKTKAGVELDFETKPSYTITVIATDTEGLTDTITVNIYIEDTDEGGEVVTITLPDEKLASAIRVTLSLEVGAAITQSDMEQLESLSATNQEITDLTGIEYAINLRSLVLTDNQISDIRPLSGLIALVDLSLQNNQIIDVTPLSGLINLDRLDLVGNPITNREPLLTLLRNNRNVKIYLKNEREPLPVTLSYFRAEHTNTGVLLKWTTESEVDNAGFYIYRSETRDGEFKVVNPAMIQGAGTTGERNKYTWTDTTAKLNTVYYYRIKDVSHAGEREQLATVRIKGLVSAKGKSATLWAVLKGKR